MLKHKGHDEKSRLVLKNLEETETNMEQLKKSIASYLKSEERLRGKRLQMALTLKGFSEAESPKLGLALLHMAEAFVDMEEYRKYMHDRIQTKTSEPLKFYKLMCKSLKDDVKTRDNALEKEHRKKMDLDKVVMKNSGDSAKITKTQMDVDNASTELNHLNSAFVDNVERFHSKKSQDIKSILYEIIYSEMQYHAKSLEILSNLQNGLFAMDLDTDIEEIREKIRMDKQSPSVKTSTL